MCGTVASCARLVALGAHFQATKVTSTPNKYTLLMMVYGQVLLVEDAGDTAKKPLSAGTYVMNRLKPALLELCNQTCDKQF